MEDINDYKFQIKNLKKELNAKDKFLEYLYERAIGDKDALIECVATNDTNEFIGYKTVKYCLSENDKHIYLEFEVEEWGEKRIYKAEWQPSDNYAVWQTSGFTGDMYSGYLLFPTYRQEEWFCLKYTC